MSTSAASASCSSNAAEFRNIYVSRLLAAHGPGASGAAALLSNPGMAREQLPRDADHLIAPFRLGREEKGFKSGVNRDVCIYYQMIKRLLGIAKGNYDHVKLQAFPQEKLLPHMVFHKPHEPDAEAWRAVESALGKKGGGAAAGSGKRRHSGATSSANPSASAFSSHASDGAGSSARGGAAAKRPRLDGRGRRAVEAAPGLMLYAASEDSAQHQRVPENLFEVLQGVFDVFWDLDIDPAISTPFFAFITRQSCGPSFGMPDYFTKVAEACTLVNIKEKLDQRQYRSVEEFEFDFMAMCENVFLYFPAQSPQYAKALELKALFLQIWGPAKAKLKYAAS